MDLSSLQPFLDWVQNHRGMSGFVVLFIAAVESLAIVGILVPGIVFMLGIGALIGLGALDFWSTFIWAATGAIVGDGVSYWLGRHYDKQLRSLWPFTKHPELILRGEQFFHKHGGKSVIFGRFIGPIRPIIPAVAGIMHMNPYHFYFVNILSAIAWAPVVLLPGMAFGSSLHLASEVAGRLVILFLILIGAVWLLIVAIRKSIAPLLLKLFGRWEEQWDFVVRNAFNSAIVLVVAVLVGGSYYIYVNTDEASGALRLIDNAAWWQQSAWEKVPVYRKQRDAKDPFTIQWWGRLEAIKQDLQTRHWQMAKTLNFKNAILWLSPSPQLESLPLLPRRFKGKKQALLMVRKLDNQRQLILRLWPAIPRRKKQQESLWLATVYIMELREAWHKIFYAHISTDWKNTEQIFEETLPHTIAVKKVIRKNVPTTEIWDGTVTLIMSR